MKKLFVTFSLLLTVNVFYAQTFEQSIKLLAADRAPGNQFGNAVAIHGNIAVIGASDISDGGIPNSCNCAYVFEKKSTGWVQIQKLVPSDPYPRTGFGKTVAINRSHIVIGAPGNDLDGNNANNITDGGAVYIFKRSATGTWFQEKKIVAADRSAGDLFGTSVSIASVYDHGESGYILVGAPGDGDFSAGWTPVPGAGSAYFVTNLSGTWEVYHKVFPVVGTYYDRNPYAGFGTSVSLTMIPNSPSPGNSPFAVIGAPGERKDTTGSNPMDAAGAAYVFGPGGSGNLQLIHKIVNWDRAPGDQFGYSVSIDKNQLVVGAPFEDEDANLSDTRISAGSAYVYNKMSDGNWYWVAKLVPPGREPGDNFGTSVSISGDMIVAGAPTADVYAENTKLNSSGAAYVFKLSLDSLSSGWRPLNKIVAGDRAENDWFGYGVAIDSSHILVGAPLQDKNIMTLVTDTRSMVYEAGAIYVFEKKTCKATTSSISVTACKTYTSPSKKYTWNTSGIYKDIITNKGGCDSSITINLTISNKADTSVTVKGNTLTANAANANYQWIDCSTNQPININTRSLIATVNGSYKVSIEVDGCSGVSSCHTVTSNKPVDKEPVDTTITTPPVTPNTTTQSNSVLKEFVEINKLVPKDRKGYENFGYAVAISGDYAVIGANVDDKDANGDNPISDAGSAYIFKKDKDGKWKQVQKIVASDRGDGDNFGWSVAINNNHIVVGAIYHDKDLSGTTQSSTGSGAVYVFELNENGTWVQKQKLIPNPLDGQTLFGHSVTIDGNTIAVGSPWYAKDATGRPESNLNGAGAVFVFDKTGGAWVQSQILTPSIRNINNLGDDLGWSVSLCGDLIIAGAWGSDLDEKGLGTKMEASGAAYIFERAGGIWKEVQKLVAGDRAAHDQFGYSVAISGDNAIIGAWNKTETADPDSRPFTGNAYIYSRRRATSTLFRPDGNREILTPDDGKWRQVLKINPEDRRPDDYLGWSVSMSGDYAIVSAKKQDTDSLDNMINDGGAIYVFYQDKNGKWSQTGKLATFDRSPLDQFGHAVAISGCNIIGGTIFDQEDDNDGNALTSAGSAYVFSAADCKNVAPCYKPKVTPDIKIPGEKTDPPKILNNKSNTGTSDKKDKTVPGKTTSADLNSKGNETTISNYDFSDVQICFEINKDNITLPPRTRDAYDYNVPGINPDGTLKNVGVIRQELAGYTDKMWSPGETIKVGFFNETGATTFITEKIKKYAKEWEKYANIKFEFVDAVGKAQIKIGFSDKGKAWSWFGRDILFNPLGLATMNYGFFTSTTSDTEFRRVIMHEFGHALGYVHEHQSPDAGINWDKEKVYAFFAAEPNNWSRVEVDVNIFNQYNKTSLNYSAYDPSSIMHYFYPAGLTTDGKSFTENDYPSATDIHYTRLFYPSAPSGQNATGILRTTDDCDEIDFSVEYNVVDTNVIEFTLQPGKDHNNKPITWWKRIGVPSKGGLDVGLEIENGSVSNKKIPVAILDDSRGISFSKAKFLGIHTLLNYKWHVMPALRGGCRVTLTWRRDSCL